MKKPWQIWVLFGLCLIIVFPAMVWLTVRTMDLDRTEMEAHTQAVLARQKAEQQERIATALWRMDWTLTPVIAQEVTRPSFVYRPFLTAASGNGGKTGQVRVASPLLARPSQFVLLYFETTVDETWSSPQSPEIADIASAVAAGVSADAISQSRERLQQLRDSVDYNQLLPLLPDSLLSPTTVQDPTLIAQDGSRPEEGIAATNRSDQPLQILEQQGEMTPRDRGQQQSYPELFNQQTNLSPRTQQQGQSEREREEDSWNRRSMSVQNFARNQRAQQFSNGLFVTEAETVREGVSRPVWIDTKLILARRLVAGNDVRIQGCWLDWPQIKKMLTDEVSDLLPHVDLIPAIGDTEVPPGRLLATLPVQLTVPALTSTDLPGIPSGNSSSSLLAIRMSLIIAWSCLLLAACAIAFVLRGVIALSERRAAFVSAVTHELRTPLTTFRMYAEMLSEGMIRNEEQQHTYLNTLRVEADRLSHLVDNVLQYARLERGGNARRRMVISLNELRERCIERLPDRTKQASMTLYETIAPEDAKKIVCTDPSAVEQVLFNLVDNACKYACSADDRRIHVQWSVNNSTALIRVTDHGPGIQAAQAKRLFQPFSKSDQEAAHTAPGIGLGLALCQRLAVDLGGSLTYDAGSAGGAEFLLTLPLQRS